MHKYKRILWFENMITARRSFNRAFFFFLRIDKKFLNSYIKLIVWLPVNMETLVNSSNIANPFHVWGFERPEKTFPGEFIGIGMLVNGISLIIKGLDFIQDFPRYLTSYMISFFETVFLGNNTVTVSIMFFGKASHRTFEPFVFFDNPDSSNSIRQEDELILEVQRKLLEHYYRFQDNQVKILL